MLIWSTGRHLLVSFPKGQGGAWKIFEHLTQNRDVDVSEFEPKATSALQPLEDHDSRGC